MAVLINVRSITRNVLKILISASFVFLCSISSVGAETFREWQAGKTNKEIWDSRSSLLTFANAGDPEAQFLASIFLAGYGDWYSVDKKRAFAYLEASAAAGYRPALSKLSLVYFWGGAGWHDGVEIDFFRAQEYAEMAGKAKVVRPFDYGMTTLLPPTYQDYQFPFGQRTISLLKSESEFMNLVTAATKPGGAEAAYQAGIYLLDNWSEARQPADYLFMIAASQDHVGGIVEHAKFLYFGPWVAGPSPTTDSLEARTWFTIAAEKGSDEAKKFLQIYKSREENAAKRQQAVAALAGAFAAFVTLSQQPSVQDQRQRQYEADQRRIQHGIETDLALGWLAAP